VELWPAGGERGASNGVNGNGANGQMGATGY
jgi:hypothetical protein